MKQTKQSLKIKYNIQEAELRVLRRRKLDLTFNESLPFTQDEINQGYHACPEWDFLVISKDDPEFECCTCGDLL